MNLIGKKLLLMGGGAFCADIKEYKEKTKFKCVEVGRSKDKRLEDVSDVYYQVDRQNPQMVAEVVKKEKIDGIFCGASEENIISAIEVAELTGCRFYVDREHWNIVSDKRRFKEYAQKSGLPVIPEFVLSSYPTDLEVQNLDYPIMIKPTDSSGARGMNPCFSSREFKPLYEEALRWSSHKSIIVEKLIEGADEVFVNYTIQDGDPTLAYCFTKIKANVTNSSILVPIFHIYPSTHLDEYLTNVDGNAKAFIKNVGLQNGTITIQGFYKDGQFMFFEAGFRMGGAQAYIFTDYNNQANVLHYMINYALTGSMSDEKLSKKENASFKHPCCNYYVALKPGRIKSINGLDKLKKMDFVLNITEYCSEGVLIEDTNALERIGYRIHVIGNDEDNLAHNLVSISQTLRIVSECGEEMQLEPLTYKRCMKAIQG